MREIKVREQNGSFMSRFTVDGKGYTHSYGSKDLAWCEVVAAQIRYDVEQGNFDPTLSAYKANGKRVNKSLKSTREMWDVWISELSPSQATLNTHYTPIYKRIPEGAKVGDTKWILEAAKKWSADTWNSRTGRIRAFGKWLVDEGYLPLNPYRQLKSKESEREEYVPFTVDEMRKILTQIAVKRPDLERFYRFLFLSGCRPAEIIGLRWTDIDTVRGVINISSVLARGTSGCASPASRVRKGTKTGKPRKIALSPELDTLLEECPKGFELVFTSATGKPIDDRNALNRVWKPCLELAGVPYRVPYNTRHTVASQLLSQGVPLFTVARTLGTSPAMLDRHYGHLTESDLPSVVYTPTPATDSLD